MDYTDKAKKLRNKLRRFKRLSVLRHVIDYLQIPEDGTFSTAKKMLWLPFLMIEWLFQVHEYSNAKTASKKQVMSLLNQMYDLQSEATQLDHSTNIDLTLRRMVIGQIWTQEDTKNHWFTLTRLYTLLMDSEYREYFESSFREANGIELWDFFAISLWSILHVDLVSSAIRYEQIITELTPHFELDTVINFFIMTGASIAQLEEILRSTSNESITTDAYFSETRLLKTPFFFFDKGVLTPHKTLATKSLCDFVVDNLRQADTNAFLYKFSKLFETYIGVVIGESCDDFTTETDIKALYKESNLDGKVTDFLLQKDDTAVFIEAKGLGPDQKMKVSDDAACVKNRLSGGLLRGVGQAFGCAKTLYENELIDSVPNSNRYSVVVTYRSFYISSAKKIVEQIAPDLLDELHQEFGNQIPLENIYFMSIREFEGVMKACADTSSPLAFFLNYCTKQDADPQTACFDVFQHLSRFVQLYSDASGTPIGSEYINQCIHTMYQIADLCLD